MAHRTGLGAEHPINDKVQPVFLVVYLGVWGLDSFVFHFSTVFTEVIPILVRLVLGALSFLVGIYLVAKSEAAIFGRTGEPKFITSGVYAWVRHPMYLGSMLVLLGFFFTTLSLLSLLMWIGLFLFYDGMATYEERDLIRILGEQYLNYQKPVPKWFIRIRRGKGES
jgi:protein-S-isoprenylcysteine O-methyltransferase Ste14